MSVDLRYGEVKDLSSQVLNMVLNMLDGDSGSIMLLDLVDKSLRIISYKGISPEIAEEVKESLGEGIAGYALKKRTSLILNNGDMFLGKTLTRSDIGSSIVLPILDGEIRVGVININRSPDKEAFSMEDLEIANLFSRYFSVLIKWVWTYHENLQTTKITRAHYRIMRNISKYRNINCMMKYLLQALLKFTKASSGAIGNYEGDVVRVIHAIPESLLLDSKREILNLFNLAIENKKELFDNNSVVFPLLYRDEMFGAVYLNFNDNLPESREIKRLKTLLRDVTLVIRNLSDCLSLRDLALKDEKTRITNMLHDRICQEVTEGILKIHYIKKLKLSKIASSEIDELETLLKNVLNDLRCIIYEEKPLALEGGFFDNLKRYIEGVEKGTGIKFKITLSGNERLIPRKVKDTIFSVIREAIVNIRRHSKADNVYVECKVEEKNISVTVKDDGIGFDYETIKNKPDSFGIRMMEDRIQSLGGNLRIESALSEGTKVEFYVPL
ncbi:MAG: GAF domain-containing protein [bacterium]|nr:GAF domain-containing protein [bacterium]